MKVVIKNITNNHSNCVLFGFDDRCFGYHKSDKDFLNLKTDEGIVIYVDGDDTDVSRKKFINALGQNFFKFKELEYSSNIVPYNGFQHLQTDANGSKSIENIFISNRKEPNIPIVVENIHKGIDIMTSYLIKLSPREEITLNFN